MEQQKSTELHKLNTNLGHYQQIMLDKTTGRLSLIFHWLLYRLLLTIYHLTADRPQKKQLLKCGITMESFQCCLPLLPDRLQKPPKVITLLVAAAALMDLNSGVRAKQLIFTVFTQMSHECCSASGTRKYDRGLRQLHHAQLHWLDVADCVMFKLCMTVHKSELCMPIAQVTERQRLDVSTLMLMLP